MIGCEVENRINGYRGIVYSKAVYRSGSCRCKVVKTDRDKNGDPVNTHEDFDIQELKRIGEGVPSILSETHHFDFDDRVICTVSGFKGKIIAVACYLNGCTDYLVTPRKRWWEKNYPESAWISANSLNLLKKGYFRELESTGGPVVQDPPR